MKKMLFAIILFMGSIGLHAQLTPLEYYGQGYQTGYNLIIKGGVSPIQNTTYQLSLELAAANNNTEYYDGLITGGNQAWAKMRGPLVKQIKVNSWSYVQVQYYLATYTFRLEDGSQIIVNYFGGYIP